MTAQQARDRRRHRRRDHRPRVGRHQGAQQAAAEVVGVDLLRHHRLGHRLLDRLSGLADAHRLHQGRARLQPARRGGERGQGGAGRAGAVPRQARGHAARQGQERPRPAALRHGRRRGGVPDQLRALPRPRRAGLRRLSQPQRRRLAVGRQHRRHPQDHQLRHPLGPEGDARLADAALRPRQAARRRADRRCGRVRAVAVGQAGRPGRGGARPEDLRRAMRLLPRRRRQGQAGAGRAQPDRRHLALRRQQARPSSRASGPDAAA